MTKETRTPIISRRRVLTTLPLIGLGLGGYAFWKMLQGLGDGTFDPHAIKTPILNKPVPQVEISPTDSPRPFTCENLRHLTQATLINFFASWCIPCVQETSTLLTLKEQGLPIWGIAYKDKPENTQRFLQHGGDPYAAMVYDRQGRIGMEWGVSGVPESFLVDRHGFIRWHSATPIENNDIQTLASLVHILNQT